MPEGTIRPVLACLYMCGLSMNYAASSELFKISGKSNFRYISLASGMPSLRHLETA